MIHHGTLLWIGYIAVGERDRGTGPVVHYRALPPEMEAFASVLTYYYYTQPPPTILGGSWEHTLHTLTFTLGSANVYSRGFILLIQSVLHLHLFCYLNFTLIIYWFYYHTDTVFCTVLAITCVSD